MTNNAKTALKILELFEQSKNNRIEGRTRIQKLVYLLQNVYDVNLAFSFIPYHYGPFSFDLKKAIQKLKELAFIEEEVSYRGWYRRYDYILSDKGKDFLHKFRNIVDAEEKEGITDGLRDMESLSLDTLVITAKSVMTREQ